MHFREQSTPGALHVAIDPPPRRVRRQPDAGLADRRLAGATGATGATGLGLLVVARVVQGFATGAAISSLEFCTCRSRGLPRPWRQDQRLRTRPDLQWERFSQYGERALPRPTSTAFLTLLFAFVVEIAAAPRIPETEPTRPSRVDSTAGDSSEARTRGVPFSPFPTQSRRSASSGRLAREYCRLTATCNPREKKLQSPPVTKLDKG